MLRKTEVNLMRLSSPYHEDGFSCNLCHQSHDHSARSPLHREQIERKTRFEDLDNQQSQEEVRKRREMKEKLETSNRRSLKEEGVDVLRELMEAAVRGLEKEIYENFRKNKQEVQTASDRIGTLEISISSFDHEIQNVADLIKELEKKVKSKIELSADFSQTVLSEELALRIEDLKISNSEILKKIRIDIENIRLKASESNEEVYREVDRIANEHQKKFVTRMELVKIKEGYESLNENALKDLEEKADDEFTKIKKKFESYLKVSQSKLNDHENNLAQVVDSLEKKVSDVDLSISKFRDSHSQQLKVLKVDIEKLEISLNFDDFERRLSKAETKLKIVPKAQDVDTSIFVQIDEMNLWKIKFDKLLKEKKSLEGKIDFLEEKITSIHGSRSKSKKFKPKLRFTQEEDLGAIFAVKSKSPKKKKLSYESFELSVPKPKRPKLSYESSEISILKSKKKKPKLSYDSSAISVPKSKSKKPKLSHKTFSVSIENKKEHNLSTETSSLLISKRKRHRLSVKQVSSLMIASPQKPTLSLEVHHVLIPSQKAFKFYTEINQISNRSRFSSEFPDKKPIIMPSPGAPPTPNLLPHETDLDHESELTIIPKKNQRKVPNYFDSSKEIEILPNLMHIPTSNIDLLFMNIPAKQPDPLNKDSNPDYKNNTFGAEGLTEHKLPKQNDLLDLDFNPIIQAKEGASIDFGLNSENQNFSKEATESAKFGDLISLDQNHPERKSANKENSDSNHPILASNPKTKTASDDDDLDKFKTKDLKLINQNEQKKNLVKDFNLELPTNKKLGENSLDGSSVEDLHFPKPAKPKIERPARRKVRDGQESSSEKNSVEDLDFEKPTKTKIEKTEKVKLRDKKGQSSGSGSVEDLNFERPAKTKIEKPAKRKLRVADEDSSGKGSFEDLNFEKPVKTKIEKPIKRKLRDADGKSSDQDSVEDMNFEKPIKTKIEKPKRRKQRAGILESSDESSSEDGSSKGIKGNKIQGQILGKSIGKHSDDEDSVIDLNFEKPIKTKIEKPNKRTPRQPKGKISEEEEKEIEISLLKKIQEFYMDFQDEEVEYCCKLADYIKIKRSSKLSSSDDSDSSKNREGKRKQMNLKRISSNDTSSEDSSGHINLRKQANPKLMSSSSSSEDSSHHINLRKQANHKLMSSSSSSQDSSHHINLRKQANPKLISSSSSSNTNSPRQTVLAHNIRNPASSSSSISKSPSNKQVRLTTLQKKIYLDKSSSNSSSSSSSSSSKPTYPNQQKYQFKSSESSSESILNHKKNSYSINSSSSDQSNPSGPSDSSDPDSGSVSSSIFKSPNN